MAILVAFGHLQTAGKLHGNLRWCRWVFLFLVFVFLLSCLPFCLSALLALFACLLSPRSALLASFSFFSFLSFFPPCFFLFILSVSFFLPWLSFRFSLPSLFSALLFSSNRLLLQQQREVTKDIKTGVNLASLKMGLNVAFSSQDPSEVSLMYLLGAL